MEPQSSILGPEWAASVQRTKSSRLMLTLVGVVLLLAGAVVGALRGQYLRDAVQAQSSAPFLLVDVPETATVGVPVSVTVTAQANDAVDTTYLGTVALSVPQDPGATLPDSYTFTAADAGTHTFDLAVSFTSEGTKTIIVTDTSDADIAGDATVLVSASGNNPDPGNGNAPVIEQPADGSAVNSTSLTISGVTTPNASVQITDNNVPLGVTTADAIGLFSYDATNLAPNTAHVFVATVDGVASAPVNVTVDTGSAATPDLLVDPLTVSVTPGQPAPRVDASVFAEENQQIRLQIDERFVDLVQNIDNPSLYEGNFLAPDIPGAYPIDVLVRDVLGNEQSFAALETLTVTTGGPVPTGIPNTPNTAPTASFTFTPTSGAVPLTVQFTAVGSDPEDGQNVRFFWDFGDGTTSTEQNPTHVYRTNGPYTPKLTVTDSQGAGAEAVASVPITPTGPAMVAGLLALSAALAFAFRRFAGARA